MFLTEITKNFANIFSCAGIALENSMAFRDRAWKLDSALAGNELARKERIRESIYRLWFSVQKQLQRFDPSASPSDHAERVEERVAAKLKADVETSVVDDEVRRRFRDVAHADRRAEFRHRIRFLDRHSSELESIADSNGSGFATALENEREIEWQIEEIRRRVDPETMQILERLYGFHAQQWTIDNLAKKMGIKRNTLEKRISRTFAQLRRELPFRG